MNESVTNDKCTDLLTEIKEQLKVISSRMLHIQVLLAELVDQQGRVKDWRY